MQNFEFYRKKAKINYENILARYSATAFLSVHNMKQKRHNFYHLPIIISKSKYLFNKMFNNFNCVIKTLKEGRLCLINSSYSKICFHVPR